MNTHAQKQALTQRTSEKRMALFTPPSNSGQTSRCVDELSSRQEDNEILHVFNDHTHPSGQNRTKHTLVTRPREDPVQGSIQVTPQGQTRRICSSTTFLLNTAPSDSPVSFHSRPHVSTCASVTSRAILCWVGSLRTKSHGPRDSMGVHSSALRYHR